MPTVILLDVSLSMIKPVSTPTNSEGADGEEVTRRDLAQIGLDYLFDYIAANDKMEFSSLVIYSSLYEVVVSFTRDYTELKKAVSSLDTFDKTRLETALSGVTNIIVDQWGAAIPCQVVLITDGNPGIGPGSLRHFVQNMSATKTDSNTYQNLPFPFPSELHIMLLANPNELQHNNSLDVYQKLLALNDGSGQVHTPDGALSAQSAKLMFSKYAEAHYAPFYSSLVCGHLKSEVQLFPPPEMIKVTHDLEAMERMISGEMRICGFLDCSDVSSPPSMSRHLVVPIKVKGQDEEKPEKTEEESPMTEEDGKTPSFCVLLHGSLKVENMVAVVNLGEEWYGFLYSWADSKKKSNLMLSVFTPGVDAIPWLGKFHMLGPASAFESNPYGEEDNKSPFPVIPPEKRSYAQNPVVWIKQNGLVSDVQKILRYARKLPDKTLVFYKELNRLRQAALSFGMTDLLEGVSTMLERECTLLPGTAHPAAALQLTHASKAIKNAHKRSYDSAIAPLSTNFASDS